jgi:hypothetical protein
MRTGEPLSAERLEERGRALWNWIDAGGSVDRLAHLDREVRRWRSDWPDRPPGEPERRNGIPELDEQKEDERVDEHERCGRALVEAVEDLARDVGRYLVARGLGDVWADLYRRLAGEGEGGHSVGPTAAPAPGDELAFLEPEGRGGDG